MGERVSVQIIEAGWLKVCVQSIRMCGCLHCSKGRGSGLEPHSSGTLDSVIFTRKDGKYAEEDTGWVGAAPACRRAVNLCMCDVRTAH